MMRIKKTNDLKQTKRFYSPVLPVVRARCIPHAVFEQVQRKPACACGGGCPTCQAKIHGIQPKMTISQPNDPYEQEADRVADQIMRMPEEQEMPEDEENIQPKRLSNTVTPQIQRQNMAENEEQDLLLTKQVRHGGGEAAHNLHADIKSLRGGGQPLSVPERQFFEPRIGVDLSTVRVHNDSRAASVAQSINARAFTIGHDISFASGEYAPNTKNGKHLLAHELTHVLQQNSSSQVQRMIMRTTYPGCVQQNTAVANANRRIDSARSLALSMVTRARAAFPRMNSRTISLVDRHFHCPRSWQISRVMQNLDRIRSYIPGLTISCLAPTSPLCGTHTKANITANGAVEICPLSFSRRTPSHRLAVTLVIAGAIQAGLQGLCMKRTGCYFDFTNDASIMVDNTYSYGWFVTDFAGYRIRQPSIIPCRPINTGMNVYVPRRATTTPVRLIRVTGYEVGPPDSIILPVFSDRSGKYFVYHNLPGARYYLPNEPMRYYFPPTWKP